MGVVQQQFYSELMGRISAPVEEVNSKACFAWQAAEGGSASWNPFNTTEPVPGASNFNSVGVKNYPSEEAGIDATAQTLLNGRYGPILAAFRQGQSGLEVCRAVDASPWGTKDAEAVYRSRYPHAP